jgi:hypothetical protein
MAEVEIKAAEIRSNDGQQLEQQRTAKRPACGSSGSAAAALCIVHFRNEDKPCTLPTCSQSLSVLWFAT